MNENEKTSKYLVEYFGGCWHELVRDSTCFQCAKCSCGVALLWTGDIVRHAKESNLDLFTWPGFGWLWGKCNEQLWMGEFVKQNFGMRELNFQNYRPQDRWIISWEFVNAINPLTFPTRVREFLECSQTP